MTCLEKLKKEHPDNINSSEAGGAEGCPRHYGYLDFPKDCPVMTGKNVVENGMDSCYRCWNREIPGTGSKNTTEKTIGAIKDSGTRREFESGAVRDIQEGKGRCDLLPLDVVAEFLEHYSQHGKCEMDVIMRIHEFTMAGDTFWLFQALEIGNVFQDYETMFLEVSKHFEEGAKKYDEDNWKKGIPVRCYIDSAVRHYLKWLRGDTDEPHDRAFCWNILCCIWTCKHIPGALEESGYGK
jgi:hypothetical protein